jgi:ankyrin repeat protein
MNTFRELVTFLIWGFSGFNTLPPPEKVFSDNLQLEIARNIPKGKTNNIGAILNKGSDINKPGQKGVTLLQWALYKNNKKSYEFLLSRGANPNIIDDAGLSPMSLSAKHEDPWYLEITLKYKGDPNLLNPKRGRTPIYDTINLYDRSNPRNSENDLKKLNMLIKSGGDINFQDRDGYTPLMVAAIANRYDIVYTLLLNGADPKIKAHNGHHLREIINTIRTSPESEMWQWREKVLKYLSL